MPRDAYLEMIADFADEVGAVIELPDNVRTTNIKPQSEQRYKGYRLYVDPQLVARSVRMDTYREMWFWHIARFIDTRGAGFAYIGDLFKTAHKLDSGLHKAEFDKYLRRGEDAGFWTCSRQARRGEKDYRRKLFYTAETKLALAHAGADGTNWPGAPKVEIPLRWGKYLPMAYAGWFKLLIDHKTRARTLINGTKKRSKRLKVVSIARATIEAVWGISPHTQIKWEKLAGIQVRHSRVQADEKTSWSDIAEYAWPYLTNDGKEQWAWDGVNAYQPPKMKVSKSKRTRLNLRRQYRAKVAGRVDSSAQPLSLMEQPADVQDTSGQGTQRTFETIYLDYGTAKDGFEAAKRVEAGRQKRRSDHDLLIPLKRQVALGIRGMLLIRQQVTHRIALTTTFKGGIDYRQMNTAEWQEHRADVLRWKAEYHAVNA